MACSIRSFMRYDESSPLGKSGHLRETPLEIHSRDADRFMPAIEADILARYIYQRHAVALSGPEAINPVADRRFGQMTDSPESLASLRVASNILSLLEFYLNRFTPLTDEAMRNYLTDARFTLAMLTGYSRPREAKSNIGMTVNPLVFNLEDLLQMNRIRPGVPDFGDQKLGYDGVVTHLRRNGFTENGAIPYDAAFCNMFTEGRPKGTGYSDLFVEVRTDPGDSDRRLNALVDGFWRDFPDADGQIGSKNRLIPLLALVEALRGMISRERSRVLMKAVDEDVYDISIGKLRPYDIMMNRIGKRDDKLNSSESSLQALAALDGGAVVRDVAEFARVLHCIMMGTEIPKNKSVRFRFNHSDLLRLMDPLLFDRNYPARLVFVSDDRSMEEGYRRHLSNRGYSVDSDDVKRRNAETTDRLGVMWPDNKSAKNRIERDRSRTTIDIRTVACGDLRAADLDQSILVTEISGLDALKWRLHRLDPSGDDLRTVVVFNDFHYYSQRVGYEAVIEIGIRFGDYAALHMMHRNGIDSRRQNAIKAALSAISDAYGARCPDPEAVRTAIGSWDIEDTMRLALYDFLEILPQITGHDMVQAGRVR